MFFATSLQFIFYGFAILAINYKIMSKQKIIFSQITSFIPWYQFDKIVDEFGGDYRFKNFKSRDHLLVMIFAQLTFRESLRAIESSLNSQRAKLYHMGIRSNKIARNTISNADETRDYRIYEQLANALTARAKVLYRDEKVLDDLEFDQSIYALDSSVINICLSLSPWAKYMEKRGVGAIKLHAMIDLKGNLPSFNVITDGKVYDGAILDILPFEAGSIYVMDRGYLDYKRLYNIEQNRAFFITRTTSNIKLKRVSSNKNIRNKIVKNADANIADTNVYEVIICDQIVSFITKDATKSYPQKLRKIKYKFKDKTNKKFKYLTFITNNLTLEAITIARLYKKRWQIELFFKWIKQHLKIKTFYSNCENGVKIQIWTAICTYLLVAIMKKELKIKHSLYTILQILSVNIFERMPINQLFGDFDCKNIDEDDCQPLLL
jgi:IS4 transposase